MADVTTKTLIVEQPVTLETLEVQGALGVGTELTVGSTTDGGAVRVGDIAKDLQSSTQGHIDNSTAHLTEEEHSTLKGIADRFTFADDGTLTPVATVPAVLPAGAYSYQFFNEFFANRAERNVFSAPGKVYISRVPYPQKVNGATNFDTTYLYSSIEEIPSATPVAKFDKASLLAKLMDNAGLSHTCATDTTAGVDDYVGKEWLFWWGHGNYVHDEYGNKHITSVKDLPKPGHIFDPYEKDVCAFGPKFWFFVKTELYQFTDSEGNLRWTTDDGTQTGQPITQLWGVSDSPWHELTQEKRDELLAHGITQTDFHIWPECLVYDDTLKAYIERPYWCHSAYMAGAVNEEGTGPLVSRANLPLRKSNLSYNSMNALYGAAVNGVYPSINRGGTAACNTGFPMLFDIIKTANKNTQKYHSGMSFNYSQSQAVTAALAYKAIPTYNTATADYIIPIGTADQTVANAQKQFEKKCTVYLESKMYTNTAQTNYRGINVTSNGRSKTTQIGRISDIALRQFVDYTTGDTVIAPCLVLDPTTVEPFLVRTTEEGCAEAQESGGYACCYVQQGFALSGETNAVLGKTDGACTNLTNGKHPFRVQGTEYMGGAWTVSADTVAIKDDGQTPVEFEGKWYTTEEGTDRFSYLYCPPGVKRINNGGADVNKWVSAGYKVIGFAPITDGYVAQGTLSSEGGFITLAAGNGANSNNSFRDYFYLSTSRGAFKYLSGGSLFNEKTAGSACLLMNSGLEGEVWTICARD